MFQPLSLFVGLRYVRAQKHRFFVSLITWVSVVGVALGVAMLITILSIMNGFEGELRDRLLSLSEHARVMDPGLAPADGDAALASQLRHAPGVTGVAPYIEITGLAVSNQDMLPVLLRGIDVQQERTVTDIERYVISGGLDTVQPGSDAVVLGRNIADQLNLHVGDTVTLMVPTQTADDLPEPRLRQFKVGGVFEAGLEEHDNTLVLANIADVRAFAPQARDASGLRLKFRNAQQAPLYMPGVRERLPAATAAGAYRASDWSEQNANYFRAVRIEKTMMSLILLLVVAVAAFNIVAMLVMVVNEKRTDIAILRTYGASRGAVLRVFMIQGLVIAWLGVISGVLLGLLLAANVGSIVAFFEHLLHKQVFDANVYEISAIPSEIHGGDVLWIAITALLLTLAATIYPARRAAATPPSQALRYE